MKLEARGLTKAYGTQRVLDKLDLNLAGSEVVCLLGPNGAGKTTLIRVLAGLLRPSAGSVLLDAAELDLKDPLTRRRIGLILHQPFLYEHLTGMENLQFYARLYRTEQSEEDLKALLGRVGLAKIRPIPVRSYSRGMKQRLTIARALIQDPQVLLFDEPYTGLDQHGCAMLNRFLEEEKARERIILVTTHELSYIRQIADRFDVLQRGRIRSQIANTGLSLDALQARYSTIIDEPAPLKEGAR